MGSRSPVSTERIEPAILVVRDTRVLLDETLAELYGVSVKALNQAVKRNLSRFPRDFMFRLSEGEALRLRSQIVTANAGRGGRRNAPYAFTEQGVAMLSSVLRSPRAVKVNVEIMRTFVRLRQATLASTELTRRIDALEDRYDGQFRVVFEAIRSLLKPTPASRRRIGFTVERPPGGREP